METVRITGKNRLSGEVRLQGAKNSALPILAAAASVDGVSVIYNCPRLSDVDAAIKILRFIGCKVEREGDTVTVDATDVSRCDVPRELMCEMRSSVIFLSPLLARLGMAEISAPGGCEIGLRRLTFTCPPCALWAHRLRPRAACSLADAPTVSMEKK